MIPNLRDVGEAVNILCGSSIMKEGVLYRGGTVNELFDEAELPEVNCILNLRTGRDKTFTDVKQVHVPVVDSVENYCTSNWKVRNWANRVLESLTANHSFPCLIHCTAGKDRTGVIVALLLLSIGISREIIVEEYNLSDGVKTGQNIEAAIDGIGRPEIYLFNLSVIKQLRMQLLVA